MWPSAYGADTVLDRMQYAGAPGAYSYNLGAGVGLSYKNPNGFNISANYISNQLSSGNSASGAGVYSADGTTTNSSGVGSAYTTTVQVGYAGSNWGAAFAYTNNNYASNIAGADLNASYVAYGANNFGFSAYWQPKQSGIIPSISAGVGTTYYNAASASGLPGSSSTWEVALQWSDAFIKGNALGMAYGATQVGGTGAPSNAYEVFYKFQVTDNISVTPAFFWINGVTQGANGLPNSNNGGATSLGGIIKTTFKF